FVPLIALMAWLVPATGSSVREPDAQAAGAPRQTLATEPVPRTAGDLLRDYGTVPPVPGSATSAGQAASTGTLKAEKCLIATLPDPIDAANLNYTYDRYLDAIQRALEAVDYVLDRFDVPWLDKDAASAAGQPPGAQSEPRFRREPGRLVFRSTSSGAGVM